MPEAIRIYKDTMKFVLNWPSTARHGATLTVADRPRETPLERTNFSFVSGVSHTPNASWLGVGAPVDFLIPVSRETVHPAVVFLNINVLSPAVFGALLPQSYSFLSPE